MDDPEREELIFRLEQTCDREVIDALIVAIEAVVRRGGASGETVAGRVTTALGDIADACGSHQIAEMAEGPSPVRLNKLLRRMGDRPQQAAELIERYDPVISSAAKEHLWRAAHDLDRLRVQPTASGARLEVRSGQQWHVIEPPVPLNLAELAIGHVLEPWIVLLAEDVDRFREVVEQALRSADEDRGARDRLRPLRDLAAKPNLERLRAVIAEDRKDPDGAFMESALRYAASKLQLLGPDELPDDWLAQVAKIYEKPLPATIRRLVREALKFLKTYASHQGRRPDLSLNDYASRVAQIYEQVSGRRMTLTRTTSTHATPNAALGLGVEFMQAALRLIDPGAESQQAAGQIDRIRVAREKRRALEARLRERAKLRQR